MMLCKVDGPRIARLKSARFGVVAMAYPDTTVNAFPAFGFATV